MLDLLNMKGKHKHKWDYLREVLSERVVYDDMLHRLWYCDDSCTQGVLFSCKQGQINMDRPIGGYNTWHMHACHLTRACYPTRSSPAAIRGGEGAHSTVLN